MGHGGTQVQQDVFILPCLHKPIYTSLEEE